MPSQTFRGKAAILFWKEEGKNLMIRQKTKKKNHLFEEKKVRKGEKEEGERRRDF